MNVRFVPSLPMFFSFFVLVFSGCSATPPKLNSDSSAIQSLNGENYQLPFGAEGNLLKQGGSRTIITGELVIQNDLPIPEPLKHQKMILLDGSKQIGTAMSDGGGKFTFTGDIGNGVYHIVLDSSKYTADQPLKITQYKNENIQVFATKK